MERDDGLMILLIGIAFFAASFDAWPWVVAVVLTFIFLLFVKMELLLRELFAKLMEVSQ